MAAQQPPDVWYHPATEIVGPALEHEFCSVAGIIRLDGSRTTTPDRVMIAYGAPVNPHRRPPGTVRIYARSIAADELGADSDPCWSEEREIICRPECQACDPVFFRDRNGLLHVFYMGFYASVWPEGSDSPDMTRTRSDLWAARSTNEGSTWEDHRIIFRGYSGATNGAIQTSAGLLLVPFSYDVTKPGRLVSACVISCDDGETWQLGQNIDLENQQGDHAGALEPAVIELQDGRIWMLIRTTLGHFLEVFSEDGGFSWSQPQPSVFRSPSSPCHITRLQSGNMAIIWNNTMDTTQGRTALHMAISEDDGRSWTEPLEVVRGPEQAPQVSYPHIYEYARGELLVRFNHVVGGWSGAHTKIIRLTEATLLGGQC